MKGFWQTEGFCRYRKAGHGLLSVLAKQNKKQKGAQSDNVCEHKGVSTLALHFL